MSGSCAGDAASTPESSWYRNFVSPVVKSLWFVEICTECPRRFSGGVGIAAGDTHSTVVDPLHTPLVSIVPTLHLSAFVLAKFLPVTDNTVPPMELPVRGKTEARIALGVY